MTNLKRAALIYNPVAGAMRRDPSQIDRIVSALKQAGVAIELCPTTCCGHATELAQTAVQSGIDVVIACGGDGTINEVAQSLVKTDAKLAVWPCGTANVLSKELRLPRGPEALAWMIAQGKARTISVGLATKPGSEWRRYFLLMAGIGVDATIVDNVDPEMKRVAGKAAYLASGLDFLARLPQTPFSIDFNGEHRKSTFTVISNAAHYAVWFTLAPDARLDDEKLDVCVFNTDSRLAYLGYALLSMLHGWHVKQSGVVYQETRVVHANSNDAAKVQLDGEVIGTLPMNFEIIPRALRVIAP